MRIAFFNHFPQVLLKDPNVLMLDEPTNHLDLESVEWLENFLRNQNIPMIIVSHDREFLDRMKRELELLSAALKRSPDDGAPQPIRAAG